MASNPITGKTTKTDIATKTNIKPNPAPGVLLCSVNIKPIPTNIKAPKITRSMIEPKITLPIEHIKAFLKEKGYYFSKVETSIEEFEDNDLDFEMM